MFRALLGLLIFIPSLLFGEGSKEMAANGGSRAFFYSSLTSSENNPFPTLGLVKVYAKPGETLYLGSSAVGIDAGGIRAVSPNNVTYNNPTGFGRIQNRSEEVAGPSTNNGADGGYIPFTHTVLAGEEGIWEIYFTPPGEDPNDWFSNFSEPTTINANSNWTQINDTEYITAFDVSVRNMANTAFLQGRAFMNVFGGNLANYSGEFKAIFKVLTNDGYQYEVNNNGQAGYKFVFFSNNKGFRNGSGDALYRSINTTTNPNIHDPRTADDADNITHKIFFNSPNTDLPVSAPSPSGNTWLLTQPTSPQVSNFLFKGKEGTDNQAGTYPLGGYVTFDINMSGNYQLQVDVNQNGSFDDGIDVRMVGTATVGHNEIFWDGLNGQGNPISGGFTFNPGDLKISLIGGEVHFPFLDVENNEYGIVLKRLNGTGAPNDVVYWDDTGISTGGGITPSNPIKTGVNGISSSSNGHKWGDGNNADSDFGNNKGLDTWSYVVSTPVIPYQNVYLKQADLEIESILSGQTSYCVGENIVYTVKVKNNGPDDVQGAKFRLDFPSGFVVSSVSPTSSGGTATLSGGNISTTAYTADLDMQNQSVLTLTITGSVSAYPSSGTLVSTASIMRPADVNDPDATNPDGLPPTDPLVECNSGTIGCNNIKSSSAVSITRVNISVTGNGVTEGSGGGTTNITFPVNLSAASKCPITLDYVVSHVANDPSKPVTNALDFSGGTSGTLTIPANQTTANITIPVAADKIVETNETFTITLSNASGDNVIAIPSAEGFITNDDQAVITSTKSDANEQGETDGRFTFSFPSGVTADKDVTIQYNLAGTAQGGGVDYTDALSGSVVIPAGNSSASVIIDVNDDEVVEGTESVILNVTGLISDYSGLNGNQITLNNTAPQLSILDNDETTLTITPSVTKSEGNTGTTSYTFTLTLNKATGSGFTINYNTTNATATAADNDFGAAGMTLNFSGTAGETRDITILVNGDTKIEGDETFFVDLAAPSSNFSNRLTVPLSRAVGNITNDDVANLMIDAADGAEGGNSAAFTFSLQNGMTVDEDVTINYTLSSGSASVNSDYTGSLTGSVILPANQNSTTLTLPVVDDSVIEGDETLSLAVNNSDIISSYPIVATNSPQSLTITDNDYGVIEIAGNSITEENTGTKTLLFTVSMLGQTQSTFTIPYTTLDGTALAGEDYVGVSTPVNISFDNTLNPTRQIAITINNDKKIEANEVFQVILGALSETFGGHLSIQTGTANGTILNDDSSNITIVPANGSETGPANASFTFKLADGFSVDQPIQIAYSLGGSAENGKDYTGSATTGTINIPVGQSSAQLILPVLNDDILENTENIVISVGPSGVTSPYGITAANSPQQASITDNDEAYISIAGPIQVQEGNAGATQILRYTLSLDKATKRAFTVNFTTQDGTARTGDNDYLANTGTLSFAGTAGETKEIQVVVNGDNKIEVDESLSVLISNFSDNFGGKLQFANTSVATTIKNDDSGGITVTTQHGAEGGDPLRYIFSLPTNITVDEDIIISYSISGSTGDLTGATSGNVTIVAGQNAAELLLPVVDDAIIEGTETVTLALSSVNSSYNIQLQNGTSHTANIADNDTGTIEILDASITEGDNGSQLMNFQVRLNGDTEGDFSIPYSTSNGTALSSEDYEAAPSSAAVNFGGSLNEVRSISVPINGDFKIEANETFQVLLGTPSKLFGGQLTVLRGSATGTITNNDGGQITIDPTTAYEQGAVAGTFDFHLPAGYTADVPIQVNYNLSGTASNGVDYSGSGLTGSVTIPVGENNIVLNLPVVDDDLVEGSEQVILNPVNIVSAYSGITLDASTRNLNIEDNDQAELMLTGPPAVTEGADGTTKTITFTVALSKATQGPFSVPFTWSDGSASLAGDDYAAASGSLSFTGTMAGEARSITATINGDNQIEADENFFLNLGNPNKTFGNRLTIPVSQAEASILNDDNGNISISKRDGAEGGASGDFTFSLPTGVIADKDVTIFYNYSGSTAANGDYVASPSGLSVTIPAGQNSASIQIAINDDQIVEGDETLVLNATSISADYGISLPAVSIVSLKITDNDNAQLIVSAPLAINEGDNGTTGYTFSVRLDKQTAQPFSVDFATQDGSAIAGEDYQAQNGTLNFTGAQNQQALVTVLVTGDRKVEADELFEFLVSGLSKDFGGSLTIATPSTSGTITNDDDALVTITKTDGAEGGTNAKYTFSFENGATSDQAVTLTYTLAGSAGAGDYSASHPASLTIPANTSSADLLLTIVDDAIVEETENVLLNSLTLQSGYAGITLDPARPVVNIADNDRARLVISGPPTVVEDNSGIKEITYTVTLQGNTQAPFSVDYGVQEQTAQSANNDFSFNPGTLNFSGFNNEAQTFKLSVNGDNIIEPSEYLYLVLDGLSNNFNNSLLIDNSPYQVDIVNDDGDDISISHIDAVEGQSDGKFVFSLPDGITVAGDIEITYTLGGTAVSGTDHSALPSGTVTLAAGQSSVELLIPVLNDDIIELTETVSITASTTNAFSVALNNDTDVLQIRDTDTGTISVSDVAVDETASGLTNLTFDLILDNETSQAFSVSYKTQDGSATAGEDYEAAISGASATFNGEAGELSSVNIVVNGDLKIENDEYFDLLLTSINQDFEGRLTFATSQATGTINNDDNGEISITKVDGGEGETTPPSFRFSFPNNVFSDQPTVINFTLNGTASTLPGVDYTANPGLNSITIPAGNSDAILTFGVNDDEVIELTETISFASINYSSPYADVSMSADRPIINITDNDTGMLTLSGPDKQPEGQSGTTKLTYTLTLDKATTTPFSIPYKTTNGTATTNDNDYQASAGVVDFLGKANEAFQFDVFIRGDRKIEADEVFNIILENLSTDFGGKLSSGGSPLAVTIENDDTEKISITKQDGNENGLNASFTFSLPPGVTADQDLSIEYTLSGTAENMKDYSHAGQILTIKAGQNSVTLPITIKDDQIVEDEEEILLHAEVQPNGRQVSMANNDVIAKIVDNDEALLSIANLSVTEGDNNSSTTMSFEVKLSKATRSPFTLSYATDNGTATAGEDYVGEGNGVLSFTGEAPQTRFAVITINGDRKIEADETFRVILGALDETFNNRLKLDPAAKAALGIIQNDDGGQITITPTDGSENGTPGSYRFAFPPNITADAPVTFNFSLAGTALLTQDYTVANSGSITIPANTSYEDVVFSVVDDAIAEGPEEIRMENLVITSPYGGITFNPVYNAITIADNDQARLEISGPASIIEGQEGINYARFDVKLTAAVAGSFEITYQTQDALATAVDKDFLPDAGTLLFAGNKDETKTINIPILSDKKIEKDEDFSFLLSNLTKNFSGLLTYMPSLSTTILNDDQAKITISGFDGEESATDDKPVRFRLSLEPGVTADEDMVISYTLGGSATKMVDYDGNFLGSITLPSNANYVDLELPVRDDQTIEGTETVIFAQNGIISNYPVAFQQDSQTQNIADNDVATLILSPPVATKEGDIDVTQLTFTLTLNKETASPVTVNYKTLDGSAKAGEDYESLAGTLTFSGTSANEQKIITVRVKGDRKVEADEDFFLTLETSKPDFINRLEVQGSPARAVILNDDNYDISLMATDGKEQGAQAGSFVFKLPDGVTLDKDAVINYSLSGTAQKNTDYNGAALSGSLTLKANANQQLLSIPVIDDNVVEGTENVSLQVSSVQSDYALTVKGSPSVLNILDNDVAELSISGPLSLEEGDSGTTTMTFEVTLNKAVAKSFTIDYRTEDATAMVADEDYLPTAGTLLFNGTAGETQKINVSISGDQKIEADEYFLIRLQNLDGEIGNLIAYPTNPVRGNILDDDNQPENRKITISKIDGEEGLNNASFTFAFPPGVTLDTETQITFALDGTAKSPNDFDRVPATVTIPAKANNTTLNLQVNDDQVIEDVETVSMQTSAVSNASYPDIQVSNPEISLNIRDNDRGQIQIADARVIEGHNGTADLEFTLRLEKATERPFTLTFNAADKTATIDEDYTNATNTIAFDGEENETQVIRFTVKGDIKVEKDETLDLVISEVSDTFNGRLSLSSDRAEGIILNDDEARLAVTATNGGEGGNPVTFTFSYQDGAVSDEALQIFYQLDGSASGNGGDYSGPIVGSVVIQPAQTSTTLTLPVIDDNLLEGDENVSLRILSISSPYEGLIRLSGTNAIAQIRDNDEASIRISGPVEIVEGNTGSKTAVFNVVLNRATGRPFSLQYATKDGSAKVAMNDYSTTAGVLNFGGNNGETRQINVQVNGDFILEPDEEFFVELSGLSDDFNGNLHVENSSAKGIIKDDDDIAANKLISIVPVDGAEDGLPAQFIFSFPTGVVNSSATNIPYALSGSAGTSDYSGSLSGTITIPAGSNSATLTLPVVNDDIIEGDEFIKITTGTVSNANFSGITIVNSPQEAKISDNDLAEISIASIELDEGNTGQQEAVFEVRLNKATGSPFTVSYNTSDREASVSDADYVARSGSLNFLGKVDEVQQIRVKVNGDKKIEGNERFNAILQSVSKNFGGNLTFKNSTATATIKNDDVAEIKVSTQNGAEQGTVPLSFRFSLPSGITSDQAIAVQYSFSGSATSGGTDYVSGASGTIAIPANSGNVLLSLPVIDDEIIEDDETAIMTITALVSPYLNSLTFSDQAHTAQIADNDQTILRLSPAVAQTEGDEGTKSFDYTITLEKATGQGFTLNYAALDGTATLQDNDYVQNAETLNFSGTAGESQTVSILVNGDKKIEADEEFLFTLSDLSNNFNGRLSIPTNSSSGTIKNDDDATITISKTDGIEGSQDGEFVFALPPSVSADQDITINYSLTGTAGTSDFSAAPSASAITIPAGENRAYLKLVVNDDSVLEERENVVLNISQIINPYNNVTLASPVPVVEIFDNDIANLTIINPAARAEGQEGSTSVEFSVKLDKTTDKPFSVKYSTVDGTATTADLDYQSQVGTLNFTGVAGETKVVTIVINSDVKIESNEDFALRLTDLNPLFDGKLILGADGKALLLNDDLAPIANNDVLITQEDTPKSISLVINDTHAEGIDPKSISIQAQPAKGEISVNTDGTINYVPLPDAFGNDAFTYNVKDIWGRLSNTATVNISITAVNDAPRANDDVFYVQKDSSIRANVGFNDVDVDGDVLSFTMLDDVQNGEINLFDNADGSFIYTPVAGFKGEDNFSYIVRDPSGLRDTATVTLYVQPKVSVVLTPEVSILSEGDSVIVTARLSESLFQDVNIVLDFDGTAENGKDYQLSGNYDTMLILAGDTATSQHFKFKALKDFLKEGNENVGVNIIAADPSPFVIIGHGTEILLSDFYPQDREEAPGENGEINPDPYMSPNNDGQGNEHFVIYNIEKFLDNEVYIYNRWGNEIFHTKGYSNTDNAFKGYAIKGSSSESGAPLADGVYYYVIYTTVNGERKINKGYVIIRR